MANFKTNIKATNYELTSEVKGLIEQKLSYFEKFLPVGPDSEVKANIEVAKTTDHHDKGLVYRAEFNMRYDSEFKRSESTQESMEAAIEMASDEMAKQIRRTKTKKNTLFLRGSKTAKKWLRLSK